MTSEKLSLLAGTAVIFLLSLAVFWKSTSVGFLLDDYFHLDYFYRAWHGHPELILQPFYRNWTFTSDSLTSYRPLISASIALDYLIWQANAFGYHLTNIIMFSGCCVFTALVGYELASKIGLRSRVLPGVAAGALFAVYPIHVESVAWIIGRVDVQCTLLYLISFYAYLVYRRQGNRALLGLSAIAFLGALASKEMAVTLPAVIVLYDLLLGRNEKQQTRLLGISKSAWLFWLILAIFAVCRTVILGTLVGGYGGGDFKTFRHSIQNFGDVPTLLKVAFGASDEVPVSNILRSSALAAFGVAVLSGVIRSILNRPLMRMTAFLALWTAVTVLPTFQIWHIYPNLVGSRLFFLGSAPLCLFLGFGCLAISEAGRAERYLRWLSTGCLLVLAWMWCLALVSNLTPWVEAGLQIQSLTTQVHEILEGTSTGTDTGANTGTATGTKILFIDVPQDHHGAPLLGRPEFLKTLSAPPFMATNRGAQIMTAERPVPGGHDYIYPKMLQALLQTCQQAYLWNGRIGRYDKFQTCHVQSPQDSAAAPFGSTKELTPVTIESKDLRWETYPDNKVAWLNKLPTNCLSLAPIAVFMKTEKSGRNSGATILPQLIWRSQRSGDITNEMNPTTVAPDEITYNPGRLRSWTLAGQLNPIGFRFPKGCDVKVKTIQLRPVDTIEPSLEFSNANKKGSDLWLFTPQRLPVQISFNGSRIHNATAVIVYLGKPWQAMPDAASSAPPDPKTVTWSKTIDSTTGSVELPDDMVTDGSIHQVTVLALDNRGKPVGTLSEPRSLRVKSQRNE